MDEMKLGIEDHFPVLTLFIKQSLLGHAWGLSLQQNISCHNDRLQTTRCLHTRKVKKNLTITKRVQLPLKMTF